MLKEEHTGGLGPKQLARCTLPLSEDFEGYAPMTLCGEVKASAPQGAPVLHVSVTILKARLDEAPPPGATAFFASAYQALQTPSAPLAADNTGDATDEPGACGAWGRGDSQPSSACGREQAEEEASPACGRDQARRGSLSSSSVFAMDPAIWEMTPNNQRVCSHLFELQRDKVANIWPLPVEPGRNYNVMGVGFRQELMDWPEYMLWRNFPALASQEDLDHLILQIGKIDQDPNDPQACLGVRVLLKMLRHLKVCNIIYRQP